MFKMPPSAKTDTGNPTSLDQCELVNYVKLKLNALFFFFLESLTHAFVIIPGARI